MGTTTYVRDYSGTVLQWGQLEMGKLLRAARVQAMPFLGSADEYDDTVFNRLQLRAVADELKQIRRTSNDLGPEVRELEVLAALADERPHRFLVFNGD